MKDSLTKNQLCWVVIRSFGIVLIFQAFLTFVGLLVANLVSGNLLLSSLSGGNLSFVLTFLFSVGAPAAMGCYLLFGGRGIHDRLMFQPIEGPSPHIPPVHAVNPDDEVDSATSLTRRELRIFTEWLDAHPEFQKCSQPDQIALFRDAQNAGEMDA
ncbi:hypothetical protein [Roseibacillus ishigakijimensis]|uniref:Uncharacterized protein n=1 Tax=Roseibacillus ishigakijimensis TaxID=454146 RepID=A0A934VKE0_9BACT|nr:hypothetical protein [Roseibacillus ishigakijimensis]MBK1833554.1 hypothetical protein [Roseibacillus ishigakijimensis]